MRQKSLLICILIASVLVSLLLLLTTFTSTSAEHTPVKLSLSQGERREIALEELLGINPNNIEVIGISFLSIKDNKLLADVPLSQKSESYHGKILNGEEEILLVAEVSDKDSPLRLELVLENGEAEAGNNLNFYLDIKVLKPIEITSMIITYEVKNPPDTLILQEQKEKTTGFSEILLDSIQIPSSTKDGTYVLSAKADFDGKSAVTSEFFVVSETEAVARATLLTSSPATNIFIALVGIVIVLLVAIIIYVERSLNLAVQQHPRKLAKIYSRFTKTKKSIEAFKKLSKQAELLDRAHRLGVMDRKTYEKERKKISKIAKKVKAKFIK